MRKLFILIALFALPVVMIGRNKLNAPARMLLNDYKIAHEAPYAPLSDDKEETVTVLVLLNDGYRADDVDVPDGGEITGAYGKVLSVVVPVKALEQLADNQAVKAVSLSEKMSPMMNKARPAGKVDKVQDGEGLEQPYDGTGIVVGLMDTGIDPNHVNFMNADLSACRVKEVYTYEGTDGIVSVSATTPEEIAAFTTDNKKKSHGTHVAGIMAGSYKDNGRYVLGKTTTMGPIPYWGVAPASDIVMSAGELYDANILSGVNKVISYAESQNKPAVVNLSLGSIIGPHDGLSILSTGLAELGKDGIICVSAGNDGDKSCAVNLGKFSALVGTYYTGLPIFSSQTSNVLEFWSDDEQGFDIDFIIYDTTTRKIVSSVSLPSDQTDEARMGGSSTSYPKDDNFSAMFTASSYIRMQNNVDPTNRRFYVYIRSDLTTIGGSANLAPGVKIYNKGSKSGMVYGYTSEGSFSNYGISTWKNGTANGSISDMATGENIIAVGAYTSASSFSYLGAPENSWTYGETQNEICSFSSYGPNVKTGVQLPVLCAPGSVLVSSINNFDVSFSDDNTSASVYAGNRENRWAPMQGTSMSCPFVSGVVALWLEADPTLKVNEIIDILKNTAIVDSYVQAGPANQWGAGKIDALAGIKEVLQRKNAGIQGVVADAADRLMLTPDGDRCWTVSVASADRVTAQLYDLRGIEVTSVKANGNQVTLDATHVTPGLYILTVDTPNTDRISRRLLVK